MPIPADQLERLQEGLAEHVERAESLRRHIADMEAEAEAHEAIVRVGQDERLLEALGELYDDPELAKRISEDPDGYAREKGIELPPGAEIRVAGDGSRAGAHIQHGPFGFELVWDRRRGFSVSTESRPAPDGEPS
jgi:hypothetical protein